MTCTTHHRACDCREDKIKELLSDVIRAHSDPTDPDYNKCDEAPCKWCADAMRLIGTESSEKKGGES